MSHHCLFQKKKNDHNVQMNLSIGGAEFSEYLQQLEQLEKYADFCDVLSDLGIFLSVFISYWELFMHPLWKLFITYYIMLH